MLFLKLIFVPMLQVWGSWQRGAHRRCALLFQCCRSLKRTMTRSLAPHHCAFFCSNAVGPNDTTTRKSTPHCCVLFCSSARGPQGHDNKEFIVFFCSSAGGHSSVWRQEVELLVVMFFYSNARGHSSAWWWRAWLLIVMFFFYSSVASPKDMTTRSSTPYSHFIFLFRCWRSPRPWWQGAQLLVIVFFSYQVLQVPMAMMRSLAPRHCALLF